MFAGTIKDNITFGMPFDKSKLDEVIVNSCLLPEISALPYGVNTAVGDGGLSLSAGLRSRIK